MSELVCFNTEAMVRCSVALRQMSHDAHSMEVVAQRVVKYLYEELTTSEGEPACALVCFFKTHLYGDLEPETQKLLKDHKGETDIDEDLICLTLLATQGEEEAWCDRHLSDNHKVIPLFSPEALQEIPMIAQLIEQLGMTEEALFNPEQAEYIGQHRTTNGNIFHVESALGSELIPAQADFVIPYKIQSVLAFGGMLPNGELFAVTLFSKVHIPQAIAQLFAPLALSVKLSILPFDRNSVFISSQETLDPALDHSIQAFKSQITALKQLLSVSEKTALHQSHYLEKTITDLTESTKAAEAANIAKSEFLSTMSHEIRTPMNAVIGMTNLLLDTTLTQQQKDFVEIIRNSGEPLMDIINDILDFSKIDAGKLELEQNTINLQECVEKTIDLFIYPAQEKNIELIYDWYPDTPEYLLGDATRIRQILANLLSNALKFTETGEIIITVSFKKGWGKAQDFLRFSVKDTGIGIPKERQDRLFKSFSQVDSSTTRKYGGDGSRISYFPTSSNVNGWINLGQKQSR